MIVRGVCAVSVVLFFLPELSRIFSSSKKKVPSKDRREENRPPSSIPNRTIPTDENTTEDDEQEEEVDETSQDFIAAFGGNREDEQKKQGQISGAPFMGSPSSTNYVAPKQQRPQSRSSEERQFLKFSASPSYSPRRDDDDDCEEEGGSAFGVECQSDGRCVIVKNVPTSMPLTHVRRMLDVGGTVLKVRSLRNHRGIKYYYIFVEYATSEEAELAIRKLDRAQIDDFQLRAAHSFKPISGSLPEDATDHSICTFGLKDDDVADSSSPKRSGALTRIVIKGRGIRESSPVVAGTSFLQVISRPAATAIHDDTSSPGVVGQSYFTTSSPPSRESSARRGAEYTNVTRTSKPRKVEVDDGRLLRTVYFNFLPVNMSPTGMRHLFDMGGTVLKVRTVQKVLPEAASKVDQYLYAFVEYATSDEAELAISRLNRAQIGLFRLDVHHPFKPIFGSLPEDATEHRVCTFGLEDKEMDQ